MTGNDGSKTNQQVFEDMFFPMIGFPPEEGIHLFTRAHRHDFAALQRPEEKIPLAREVVQEIFALGLQVVIATNPIFPKDIMYQRLR